MPQTFQLPYGVELEVEMTVGELVWSYGDGFDDQAFVGHTGGHLTYRFSYFAPNRTTHQVTDPEDSIVKTYPKYFKDFWLRRKIDGADFNVTDPITGAAVLVKFIDSRIVFRTIGKTTFQIQAAFRQHRS